MAVVVLLWIAIHRVSWLGPALAEGARAVVGPRAVAWMEDVAYGLQDRIDRWLYRRKPPKSYWEPPPSAEPAATHAPGPSEPEAAAVPAFFPKPFEAPYPDVAASADGIWVPVPDARDATAPVAMYKTMVHPDPKRGFAVLAVVAVDTRALELVLQAGTAEPSSNVVQRAERTGLIPAAELPRLVAAFNGGFRTIHGQYGMMLGGKEYLPPRDIACTLARYRDGSLRIGTWSALKSELGSMTFYRQTPPCLVEEGDPHKALQWQEHAKGWGATVGGDTVIRRSAVGLNVDRKVLFYGVGDALTAQAIARGMKAVGAHMAAELDVNYSYPRFLLYEQPSPSEPPKATSALIPSIEFNADEYVTRPCERDFFYLLRTESPTALRGLPVADEARYADRRAEP